MAAKRNVVATKQVTTILPLLGFLLFAVAVVAILWMAASYMRRTDAEAPRQDTVRVVVVDAGAKDQPPVYPRQAPSYPLRGVPQEYQQLGVLVSKDGNEKEPILLALFGRKMATRDRWEYYVASDKFHMWKLPIQQKNRMCDDDVGCEEIYTGDEITVPDYAGKTFVARIYKYGEQ